MADKIVIKSTLDVKATAALSKEIAENLSKHYEDKDMGELLNGNKCTTGNDGRTSDGDDKSRLHASKE